MEKLLQITSGRGPAECCWVVAQIQKKIIKEANSIQVKTEIVQQEQGGHSKTLNSSMIRIIGKKEAVETLIKSWQGSILWIGNSPFRKFHKRKNWFVGVHVFNSNSRNTEEDKNQIRYEVFRSSGPGGQHSNKVSSAVRAVHIPTGISAKASDSRSQQQNKKKATERLWQLIHESHTKVKEEHFQSQWQQHNQLERGNPVRTFKGPRLVEVC